MVVSHAKTIDVVGIGNVLIDLLVEVPETYLRDRSLTKGGMHLVADAVAEEHLAAIADLPVTTEAGGSAANVIRGVQSLGGSTALFGAAGNDIYADIYRSSLTSLGVHTQITTTDTHTGYAITYVTPDSERTFVVAIGAAQLIEPQQLDESTIAAAHVLHLEGYQLEGMTRATLEYAIALAHNHHTLVSLDVADAGVVGRLGADLRTIVHQDVDIVFANELEAAAYTGQQSVAALRILAEVCDTVVVKCGAAGALISHHGTEYQIPAVATNVIDTTGAGDMFAAGFLYGLTHHYDIASAGQLGAKLAAKIISQIGVRLSDDTRTL